MTPKEYLEQSARTVSDLTPSLDVMDGVLLHAGLGMATESAEFLDALKKYHYYNKPLDTTNLKEELGDQLWYIAMACRELGVTFEELMEMNINKLRVRYPEKFDEVKAQNRDLVAERKTLE